MTKQAYWDRIINKQLASFPKSSDSMDLRALLCGFLAGDGSVQVRREGKYFHYQLDFFPDDELMMNTYIDIVKCLYSKVPSVRFRDNVFHVRLTSKAILLDILSYANFGLKSWNIPCFISNNPLRMSLWLKGFFSAEAYVGKKEIKVQTVNETGMAELSSLLSNLGIDHSCYSYTPKIKNHSKTYIVVIGRKEARLKYFRKVGFFHSKKHTKLSHTLSL